MTAAARSRTSSWIAVAAALAALYLAVFAIVGSAAFARAPGPIALAATLDLTLTATVLVWWLGVRRQAVSPWFAVVVLSWGVACARRWVPHAPLGALVAVGGGLEVITVGWLMIRIRRVVRGARAARGDGPIGSIEAGLTAARLPARIAAILATELAVVGLAVTGWFRRPAPGALAMRSTGWILIAWVIGFLVAVESAATHVVLALAFRPLAAWIASASAIYVLVWLIGDAQAIRLYPVAVADGVLHLRLGVRWRGKVALDQIRSIERITAVPAGAINLALMEPTVLVTLRGPIELRGLFGKTRRGDQFALTIDDPEALIAATR
jgi:hypothetical protein